jgi:cytochrome c55X
LSSPPTACAVFAAALACAVPAYCAESDAQSAQSLRQSELVRLVRQDCGSCHGMTLAGGLGPALSKEALAQRPQSYLQEVILHGIPGTPMPSWRGLLSDQDAQWIARELLRGFPDGR